MKTNPRIPTEAEIIQFAAEAHAAGSKAADAVVAKYKAQRPNQEYWDVCGFVYNHLGVYPHSRLGKFLLQIGWSIPGIRFNESRLDRGILTNYFDGGVVDGPFKSIKRSQPTISVYFDGLTTHQDLSVQVAGAKAAMEVLTRRLGVEGRHWSRVD